MNQKQNVHIDFAIYSEAERVSAKAVVHSENPFRIRSDLKPNYFEAEAVVGSRDQQEPSFFPIKRNKRSHHETYLDPTAKTDPIIKPVE